MLRYIIIALVLLLLYAGIAYVNLNNKLEDSYKTSILNDSLLQKKILAIRDSSGREIQVYRVKTITQEQLLTSNSEETQQLREDLKLTERKLKNLISSTTVGSITHDTVEVPVDHFIHLTDTGTFSIPIAPYNPDSFLTMGGSTSFTRVDSGFRFNNINLNYSLKNSSSISYLNKTRFLRKSLLELAVTQDNPKTTTNKVQTYYLKPEKKWFEKTSTHIAAGIILGLTIGAFYLK